MSAVIQTDPLLAPSGEMLVNDFSIVAATVNGSGSQTANSTLMRALFKMGIPVNGKNLFPSNISGLPTWYTIRLSKDGYVARRDDYHVLVAMNPATQAEDIAKLAPGGICIYPEDWKLAPSRTDISYFPIPSARLAKESGADANLRDYVANMAYVGALVELLGIDINEIKNALSYHFSGKPKPIAVNFGVVEQAAEFTRQNYTSRSNFVRRFRAEPMHATAGLKLIEGNSAAALGALFGGVTVVAWYPITPSTGMIDALREYAAELRVDPATGQMTCAVLQAEDELAAIGIVIGAGWTGARALTATSGPGISLMAEFAGLAYFAEVPSVIWDVQRMGPSTGLPTRVSQGDVLKVYFLSHGDTRHIVLLPGSMKECFEFGWKAFDLAERLQTAVFCLTDLDLGMNLWMTEPFNYPDDAFDRGKVLTAEDLNRLGGFARYKDVDGDGIGYRTLPGTDHPMAAFLSRGTGHNENARYSERPDDWEKNLRRLARKHDAARTLVPAPIDRLVAGAKSGIIAYGSSDPGVTEALDLLAAEGQKLSYQRLRALPFREETRAFVAAHDRIYVVENNFDGQMALLLRMEYPDMAARFVSLSHCDGLPLTARWIARSILEQVVEQER
ncbi:MAG TPA: 2-oxoacid:acceptor oxidoreductase subunit alpha [Aggregatilineales bacterium]|nr:2-oxoacid:acceptor oxidoreductase subunit alpha [Aggregatilineales bacterium]